MIWQEWNRQTLLETLWSAVIVTPDPPVTPSQHGKRLAQRLSVLLLLRLTDHHKLSSRDTLVAAAVLVQQQQHSQPAWRADKASEQPSATVTADHTVHSVTA